jgi:ferredoxin
MMSYKIVVDRNLCIACGVAPMLCTQVFILGEDNGKNRLIERFGEELSDEVSSGVIPDELYDCVTTAAEACPVQAITVQKI